MDANRTTLAFLNEAVLGVLPVPANFQKLRFTKEALEYSKDTVNSEEIRSDRNESEAVRVGVGAKGTVDFEMAITDFEWAMAAALGNTWNGNTLINGIQRPTYQIEKQFPLPDGATISYMLFAGMVVNQFMLTMTAKQIVTGQVDFLGVLASESTVSSDTSGIYAEPGTGLILSASSNVALIKADNVTVPTIKSLAITVQANARTNDVIGSEAAADIPVGAFSVTGKMDAYFNDRTLLSKFMTHGAVSLTWRLIREAVGAQVGDTIGYDFEIPVIRFTKGNPSATGKNTDVMLPLEFKAEGTAGARASQALTQGGQPLDTETVTIGGKVYTWQTVLTNVDGNVKIGATAALSLVNLKNAINLGAGVPGTDYALAMTQHPTVTAVLTSALIMTATATAKGTAGNAIATTETSTNYAWGAATMAGGLDVYSMKVARVLKA